MYGCIHVYSVIFEADMASDFVGATCNGWAAKYLFVVVDIPCMHWRDWQASATNINASMYQNIMIYELHVRYQRCGN
jgi:hypothetical protein